jgi:signal transduction histidine kinase
MNLIENSIKYTDQGSVNVELKGEGENIKFSVTDTGAGIKKEDMGKLFQKFSRGTGATASIDGTGLGLYVAKQMVEAHKGKIWAESKGEGMGSKFCFTLPV